MKYSDLSFIIMPDLFSSCPTFFRHARPFFVMPGLTGHLLLLQRVGRVGAGGAEGLPEDGEQGYSE